MQFATTTPSGIIVGVSVTNSGSASGQLEPMLAPVEARYQQRPAEVLVDGGFTPWADLEAAEAAGTKVDGPSKDEAKQKAPGDDPYQPQRPDGPGVARWRPRRGTATAQTIYRERAATAEWTNAGARNRGLYQVRVRGVPKVLAVALLQAVAHHRQRSVGRRAAAAAARKG